MDTREQLHTRRHFPSTNHYGIPNLLTQPNPITPPPDLYPYRYGQKIRTDRPVLIHFHTSDRRFEGLWLTPSRILKSVSREQIWSVCSPDFSLWLDFPLALQIYNTYRNRWLGRYFQEQGLSLIPTVNWSSPRSYDFAFLGVPKYQTITLRTYNSAGPERALFIQGYRTMLQTLEPSAILWFGVEYPELADDPTPKYIYPVGYHQEVWA